MPESRCCSKGWIWATAFWASSSEGLKSSNGLKWDPKRLDKYFRTEEPGAYLNFFLFQRADVPSGEKFKS